MLRRRNAQGRCDRSSCSFAACNGKVLSVCLTTQSSQEKVTQSCVQNRMSRPASVLLRDSAMEAVLVQIVVVLILISSLVSSKVSRY